MIKNYASLNKIKAYSAMAISYIAITNTASAQVVYTDIDPDQTFDSNGENYEVDINNDLVIDFKINILSYPITSFFTSSSGGVFSGMVQGVFIFPYNGAEIVGYGNSSMASPYVIENAALINEDMSFQDNVLQYLNNYQVVIDYPTPGSNYVLLSYGYWGGATDKYLGVRFEVGGNKHYGYIRLDVSNNHHEFTIKDYAYNATPFEAIVAGDIGDAIFTVLNDEQVIVYSNANLIHLVIKDQQIQNAVVNVFDLSGQIVYTGSLDSNEKTIQLANATGYYAVQILTEEKASYSKKLFIQN